MVESGSADDFYHLGLGTDTVIFDLLDRKDAVGGNGLDTWSDFHVGNVDLDLNADQIDVSALLSENTIANNSELAKYISVEVKDGNTVLSIDRDGKKYDEQKNLIKDQFTDTEFLVLQDTTVSLDDLLKNGQIIY